MPCPPGLQVMLFLSSRYRLSTSKFSSNVRCMLERTSADVISLEIVVVAPFGNTVAGVVVLFPETPDVGSWLIVLDDEAVVVVSVRISSDGELGGVLNVGTIKIPSAIIARIPNKIAF